MNHYTQPVKKCPEHKGESLKMKDVLIKYPSMPNGIVTPMDYCPKSNKYLSEGKLVPVKEAALKAITFGDTSNLKLEDIIVEEDASKFVRKLTA